MDMEHPKDEIEDVTKELPLGMGILVCCLLNTLFFFL